jgi:hypothetical protein
VTAVRHLLSAIAAALAIAVPCAITGVARAEGTATWRSEQPIPHGSSWPVGLGHVGDIEFWAPNRGVLITAGAPPTVAPGVWAYNGVEWHSLATVCGATEGSIAWAGPDEFWTVSDGRPGQAGETTGGGGEREVPLADNTLCHFASGQVVASYAHPAFQPDSYMAMHAAACIAPTDCWFAGDPLPEPQIGAFHLHWNGSSLESEAYPGEGHPVWDMRALEGRLLESVRIATGDQVAVETATAPAIHLINPIGVAPTFEAEDEGGAGLPLYAPTELPKALDFLHLSAADGVLWAAAGAKSTEAVEAGHVAGQVTIATRESGSWRQVIGPAHPLPPIFPGEPATEQALLGGEARNAQVTTTAAEPGTGSAWVALREPNAAPPVAVLARISSEGKVLEAQTLPTPREQEEGIGPKGAAARLSCPAENDCWLATTQGWLFHLAPEGERTSTRDEDPSFAGPITFRPPDQGLPQVPPDAPPPDTSGLVEEGPSAPPPIESKAPSEAKITAPLLSHVHSKLIHGSTLQLTFHLAVKARVRLVAKRRRSIVAATPRRTLGGGTHTLMLRLDPRRWPTKLSLETHALAPLPLVSSVTGEGANIGTLTTSMRAPLRAGGILRPGSDLLP